MLRQEVVIAFKRRSVGRRVVRVEERTQCRGVKSTRRKLDKCEEEEEERDEEEGGWWWCEAAAYWRVITAAVDLAGLTE